MAVPVNRPRFIFEVDFVNDPLSTVETWTNITPYVRAKGIAATLFQSDRGRNYELARVEAGTFAVTLDNTDGRFDPNNALSPYVTGAGNPGGAAGLVTSQRRLRVRATWLNVTYGVFRGNVEAWPQRWSDGGFSGEVGASGSDAFAILANVNMTAMPVSEVLKDNPSSLFRLTETSGANTAGNSATTVQPNAVIKAGKVTTGAAFTFGGQVGAGKLLADPSSSLTLTPITTGTSYYGFGLRTADLGVGPLLPLATGFTVECWFNTANGDTTTNAVNSNSNGTVFVQKDRAGNVQARLTLTALNMAYAVQFQVANFDAFTVSGIIATATGVKSVTDGAWHHIVGVLSADMKTATLYIDGVAEASVGVASAALIWNAPYSATWGANLSTLTGVGNF